MFLIFLIVPTKTSVRDFRQFVSRERRSDNIGQLSLQRCHCSPRIYHYILTALLFRALTPLCVLDVSRN